MIASLEQVILVCRECRREVRRFFFNWYTCEHCCVLLDRSATEQIKLKIC